MQELTLHSYLLCGDIHTLSCRSNKKALDCPSRVCLRNEGGLGSFFIDNAHAGAHFEQLSTPHPFLHILNKVLDCPSCVGLKGEGWTCWFDAQRRLKKWARPVLQHAYDWLVFRVTVPMQELTLCSCVPRGGPPSSFYRVCLIDSAHAGAHLYSCALRGGTPPSFYNYLSD